MSYYDEIEKAREKVRESIRKNFTQKDLLNYIKKSTSSYSSEELYDIYEKLYFIIKGE